MEKINPTEFTTAGMPEKGAAKIKLNDLTYNGNRTIIKPSFQTSWQVSSDGLRLEPTGYIENPWVEVSKRRIKRWAKEVEDQFQEEMSAEEEKPYTYSYPDGKTRQGKLLGVVTSISIATNDLTDAEKEQVREVCLALGIL